MVSNGLLATDYLKPSQIVAASGTLVLIFACGVVFGPTLGSLAVQHYGPEGLFFLLAIVQGSTVATALFRLRQGRARADIPVTAVAMTFNVTPGAARLNPDTPLPEGGAT